MSSHDEFLDYIHRVGLARVWEYDCSVNQTIL